MGSQIVLNANEQHPFRIGLNKLRAILNDPAQLEDLAARGLHEISVVADHLESGNFANLFHNAPFQQWANGVEGWDGKRSFFCWFQEFKSDEQREQARKALIVLRDTLNDKSKYEGLVQIGPCALTLCWDDEAAYDEEAPVLISNFIPEGWPNADYSIRTTGETYFHS